MIVWKNYLDCFTIIFYSILISLGWGRSLFGGGGGEKELKPHFKNYFILALLGMAQLVGYPPMHQEVTCSIRSQGHMLGMQALSLVGSVQEIAGRWCTLASISISLPPLLSVLFFKKNYSALAGFISG